jgi:hypothetical protein
MADHKPMPDRKPPKTLKEKDGLRGLVPASGKGKEDEVYGAYLEEIGVETDVAVQQALARDQDPRFRRFLELISTPGRVLRLQTVAKQCDIDLLEFGNWFQRASSQIAIAHAQRRAAGIVRDMAGDAMTRDEFCERCDGLGWVSAPAGLPMETAGYRILATTVVKRKNAETGETEEHEEILYCRTCPGCHGVMSVRKPGDEHSRDRVLEIAGLITKGKSGVQIVQNFGGAGHGSAVSGALGVMTIDVDVEPEDDDGSGSVQ